MSVSTWERAGWRASGGTLLGALPCKALEHLHIVASVRVWATSRVNNEGPVVKFGASEVIRVFSTAQGVALFKGQLYLEPGGKGILITLSQEETPRQTLGSERRALGRRLLTPQEGKKVELPGVRKGTEE